MVQDFECRFAESVGSPYAVAVSSGSAALFLAFWALLDPGSEVIVPDFTHVATASMVLAAGSRPVFAEIDPETFTLDVRDVERRLSPHTRAIAPVHLFGHPADVTSLTSFAARHNLRVIWDASQACGASFEGRDVGSFPDVVCYSFSCPDGITTGEGGMLTTRDSALAKELRLFRSHGEEDRYYHVRLGFNFRMTDFAAALGRAQLARLPEDVSRRQENAEILRKGLENVPGIQVPRVRMNVTHAFSQFTLRVDQRALRLSRNELQTALARRGIETSVQYPTPLHCQPVFVGADSHSDFPVSTAVAKSVLSIPVHSALGKKDLEHIIRCVQQVAYSTAVCNQADQTTGLAPDPRLLHSSQPAKTR